MFSPSLLSLSLFSLSQHTHTRRRLSRLCFSPPISPLVLPFSLLCSCFSPLSCVPFSAFTIVLSLGTGGVEYRIFDIKSYASPPPKGWRSRFSFFISILFLDLHKICNGDGARR